MSELSPKANHDKNKGGLSSPEPSPLVLRTPVDVYIFSLALLTVLAVIFMLHWARAIFIPLMLGVMISYALSPPVNLMKNGGFRALSGLLCCCSVLLEGQDLWSICSATMLSS